MHSRTNKSCFSILVLGLDIKLNNSWKNKMPRETSTQRKRRLAKAKVRRQQKLANETIEERQRRLERNRKNRKNHKLRLEAGTPEQCDGHLVYARKLRSQATTIHTAVEDTGPFGTAITTINDQICEQPIMASTNYTSSSGNLQINTIIKEEEDIEPSIHEDMTLELKSEMNIGDTIIQENVENPYTNVQLVVKQETISLSIEAETTDSQNEDSMSTIHEFLDESKGKFENYATVPKFEMDCVGVKEESVVSCKRDESLVTYDYPNFDEDEVESIDSNDAAALTHVEACLQDDMNIKSEDDGHFEDNQKEEYGKMNIKEESDFTVTETHLISNKVINTTSTITNPHDGLIESKTTKTLVMEILPVSQSEIPFSKHGNPEEILPTTHDNDDDYMDYQDAFQLNSITGNVLSLEQEAYGLLKAKGKKKDKDQTVYKCPKCPKTYRQKKYIKKHLAVHDTIEKRAQGLIKSKMTKKENRNKKLKTEIESQDIKKEQMKKEGYECTCGQVFQRRSRMETCLRSHNLFSEANTFPCMSCSKQFKDKEELALHRKRLHRKRFPCKFCPTDYHTRKELFKHLQVHQKVQLMEYKVISEVVKGNKKLKCFMCTKSYMELSDLKSHVMDDHKEPYSCRRCKRTFSKIIDFGHHTKTFHPEVEGQSVLDVLEAFSKLVKAWKCEECGLQFHEADKLAMHQIEKHSPELKAEPQFQCTDCRRVFISQKGLTSHRRVHHSTESIEESETVEQGVMCLECRKICKDMNALVSHMRLHSPDRKYPCKFCDFRFATPEKRKAHAEIHTGDMKYVCFICEYQCSSENRLKHHKLSPKHINMKEFLLTGKPLIEVAQSTSKQEKIKETSKKKEWAVKKRKEEKKSESESSSECSEETPCDICGDKFPSESEMLEHKQTHPFIEFPNDDKPSRIFFK